MNTYQSEIKRDIDEINRLLQGYDIIPQQKGSLQRIYYGAPGVGKSHEVNRQAPREKTIRTTFHPDSDYSTFVGAYKPTMNGDHITYSFVPQAFLSAYIEAWQYYPEPRYLVIEEINRGNCAQIFGDIFQLLDRDEHGFSKFPINADRDIMQFIVNNKLTLDNCDLPESDKKNITSGKQLILPNNLYIFATMNTSDQSLFPIDSAFKRRWDWVYMPITNVPEKHYKIDIDGEIYRWWDFLKEVNKRIGAITNSEDKKLGFFFCQSTNNEMIDADMFVSKVLFYLWNDVFKDYGLGDSLFKTKDEETLTFDMFYNDDRSVNTIIVNDWLEKLGVKKYVEESLANENDDFDDTDEEGDNSMGPYRYSINGEGEYRLCEILVEVVKIFVKNNSQMSSEDVIEVWKDLNLNIRRKPYIRESWVRNPNDSKTKRYEEVLVGDNRVFVTRDIQTSDMDSIIEKVGQQNWNIKITKVNANPN